MKKYKRPTEQFFCLPNKIFDLRLTPVQFMAYAYLVCCSGSKGYCWPSQKTSCSKTGLKLTSLQNALKMLVKRQLIKVTKHKSGFGYPRNEYTLLDLDNPEVFRDVDVTDEKLTLSPEEALPF